MLFVFSTRPDWMTKLFVWSDNIYCQFSVEESSISIEPSLPKKQDGFTVWVNISTGSGWPTETICVSEQPNSFSAYIS